MDLVKVYEHTTAYSKKFDGTPSVKLDINNIELIQTNNNFNCIVEVENSDSFDMANSYFQLGLKPLVLNMAS